MQAPLKQSALSDSGHQQMVNGRAAASGEKRMELSEQIAWVMGAFAAHFGSITPDFGVGTS